MQNAMESKIKKERQRNPNKDTLEEDETFDNDATKNSILIINLVDEDDDDSKAENELKMPVNKATIVDEDIEIICLDDDDDEELQAKTAPKTKVANKTKDINSNNSITSFSAKDRSVKNIKDTNEHYTDSLKKDQNVKLISDTKDNLLVGVNNVMEENKEKLTKPNVDELSLASLSSSSNLLQEIKARYNVVPTKGHDNGKDDDINVDNDVMIDLDFKDESAPSPKRLRLCTKTKQNENKENFATTQSSINVTQMRSKPESKTKIINDVESSTSSVTTAAATNILPSSKVKMASDVGSSPLKKLKVHNENLEQMQKEQSNVGITNKGEIDDFNPESIKSKLRTAIASDKPISLYPTPRLEATAIPISSDIHRRFRKTFNQMNKNELEELVLQKIVEALVHKNELAAVRTTIEKQEKQIALHRVKLLQLTKQYHDLEMLHSRVCKAMRENNRRYVMPAKITRGVAVQVTALDTGTKKNIQHPKAGTTDIMTSKHSAECTQQNRPTTPQPVLLQSKNNVEHPAGGVKNITTKYPVNTVNASNTNNMNSPISSTPRNFLRPKKVMGGCVMKQLPAQQQAARLRKRNSTSLSTAHCYSRDSGTTPQKQQRKPPSQEHQSALARQPSFLFSENKYISPNQGATQQQQLAKQTQFRQTKLLYDNQQSSTESAVASNYTTLTNGSTFKPAIQHFKHSHPAPLPATSNQRIIFGAKLPPPPPTTQVQVLKNGIFLSWAINKSMDRYAEYAAYQVYAYEETNSAPSSDFWRHIGDVKALSLPMSIKFSRIQEGQRFYFAVRAVDTYGRYGQFSTPETWI